MRVVMIFTIKHSSRNKISLFPQRLNDSFNFTYSQTNLAATEFICQKESYLTSKTKDLYGGRYQAYFNG